MLSRRRVSSARTAGSIPPGALSVSLSFMVTDSMRCGGRVRPRVAGRAQWRQAVRGLREAVDVWRGAASARSPGRWALRIGA
ncbi:hypothetical protein GCM10010420_51280 [Streptomyces glaucosporus]|uniref:Uncharacterized protein n=1 Tax=Streptomyces glaucosporus TaxID=284044 RepID=A0ABN3IXF4_9ACTN